MAMVHEKMIKVMQEMSAVGKDSVNTFSKYNFRGIDAVMNVLHPLLSKHGLVVIPQVLDKNIEVMSSQQGKAQIHAIITYSFRLCAEDGSMTEPCIMLGEGMDTGDKACNKAMAVAMKYALFQMFCIPTEEMAKDDPDNYSPEIDPPAKVDTTNTLPPVQKFNPGLEVKKIKNELGLSDDDFKAMRENLIKQGIVKDIPSAQMAMADWITFFNEFRKAYGKASA